jgi:OOP family OmpA-OmpF porin
MESVMDMAQVAFGGETLARISAWLRESPANTQAAVRDALPVSLLGVAEQASSEEGSRALLGRIQRGDYPHLEPEDLGRALADPNRTDQVVESSQGFMGSMFGSKLEPVLAGMSRHTGVDQSALSKLLGLAGPLILGMIGKRALTDKLDANGLRRFLGEQRQVAAGMLPGSLTRLLSPAGTTPALVSREDVAAYRVEEPRRAFPWWFVGILGLLAAVLAFGIGRLRHRQRVERAVDVSQLGVPAAPLAAGNVAALGYFLDSQEATPKRFLLKDLRFESSSAQIDPTSSAVLDEVAAVLVARPSARVRVEGHTDAAGSPDSNRRLSDKRALATKSYLTAHGVDSTRIETAGFGAERPVAGNDTPAGQAENRRTELVITAR